MANILDRIFGNCEKNIHKYTRYLVKSELPFKTEGFKGNVNALNAIKDKKYVVRCSVCGKSLGENDE